MLADNLKVYPNATHLIWFNFAYPYPFLASTCFLISSSEGLTHYCRAVKNDILTISGYKIFFSTNIYSSKLCNISFETAQNMLYRKK